MHSNSALTLEFVDSHTGGEPTRLIIDGFPDLGTGSMAERCERFSQKHDLLRRAIVCEPRGSDVLVGALLLPPVDPAASAGILFFNNVGTLGMCGHGTIGVVRSLEFLGKIGPGEHLFETPVGPVQATLHPDGRVSFRNVPAFRHQKDVIVDVAGHGPVRGDVAWGGNWFFITADCPIPLEIGHAAELTAYTSAIRNALEAAGITGKDGAEIDHIELSLPSPTPGCDARNFVLCPGLAWDRSPCGTGTSAKLACLAADGKLDAGKDFRQESTTGSVFEGRWEAAGNSRILPTITGRAFITAQGRLLLEDGDPLAHGF